jgi:transposase-like protein
VIALAVRWYLRYRLSYADLAKLLAERGIHVDPSTIFDWVQHFTPLYQEAARAYRHAPRGRWSIDETSIKVGGVVQYIFRAIDECGQVIDVFVSPTRDTKAAITFLQRAIGETEVRPQKVATDKGASYPPALGVVLLQVRHVASKLDQQVVARDHQHLKGRYRPMRGFKQTVLAEMAVRARRNTYVPSRAGRLSPQGRSPALLPLRSERHTRRSRDIPMGSVMPCRTTTPLRSHARPLQQACRYAIL